MSGKLTVNVEAIGDSDRSQRRQLGCIEFVEMGQGQAGFRTLKINDMDTT